MKVEKKRVEYLWLSEVEEMMRRVIGCFPTAMILISPSVDLAVYGLVGTEVFEF